MQIVGHREPLQRLEKLKARRPSALLFVGPVGVGKRTIAVQWAKDLTGDRFDLPEQAGFVRTERVFALNPEGTQIKMEAIRALLGALAVDRDGESSVVIVDRAESLGGNAANALLKVVEEPPPGTTFVFIAPSEAHVLATIRSRSQVVRFSALSEGELKLALRDLGVATEDAFFLKLARGSVGRYLELASEGSGETRAAVEKAADCVLADLGYSLHQGFERGADPTRLRLLLSEVARTRESALLFVSFLLAKTIEWIRSEVNRGSALDRLNALCELLVEVEEDIRGHIDRGLVFDVLESKIEGLREKTESVQ